MKLIDTIKQLYLESVESEIEKLRKMHYNTVDRFTIGNYDMLLLYNDEEDFYEVSLTSHGQDFTTFDSQVKKKNTHGNIGIDVFRKMAEKLRDWLEISSPLLIGTLNEKRAYKYHRLLTHFGFNTTPVKYNTGDNYFPDYWDFSIS